MKSKSFVAIGIIAAVLLVVAAFFVGRTVGARSVGGYSLDKLQETFSIIDQYYVDQVSIDSIADNLIPKVFRQLDPHSTYLSAEMRANERERLEGRFYGIGITFNQLLDTVVVISTIPNGPSDIVGIRPGDRIVGVDGRNIAGIKMNADSVRSLLRGPDTSLVRLEVIRPSSRQRETIQVRRGEVAVEQISASCMLNDSLGYISFKDFTLTTYNEFLKAYAALTEQGMKGLVIDIRGNWGGIMNAAILLSNACLEAQRPIIYTEGRAMPREDVMSDGTGIIKQMPLYVLIDEESASSAEIFAGAMQDNDRAVLIGRRSFGKGLVQRVFDYGDGSAVHLTIARYHTPSGRSIQKPYERGNDQKYNEDSRRRYYNGELFSRDSIRHDGKPYHTLNGREVYGGGGIIPDIFVPIDTMRYNPYYAEIQEKQLVHLFAFMYADKHRELLTRLGDPIACNQFLQNQGLVWQLAKFAGSRGVLMRNYLVYLVQDILTQQLSTLIIDYIYGRNAASLISSQQDKMVQKAVDLFRQGIYSPLELSRYVEPMPKSSLAPNTTLTTDEPVVKE